MIDPSTSHQTNFQIRTRRRAYSVKVTLHSSGLWAAETERRAGEEKGVSAIGASMDKALRSLSVNVGKWEREHGEPRERPPLRLPEHRCGDKHVNLALVTPDDEYRRPYFQVRCSMCGLVSRGDTPVFAMKNWLEMEALQ